MDAAKESPTTMPRQSTEDMSMDVMSARTRLLEAENHDLEVQTRLDRGRIRDLEQDRAGLLGRQLPTGNSD
eukprot:s1551_g13.t1